jgi:hypothetical protein
MRASCLLFVLLGCEPATSVDDLVVGGALLAVRVEIDAGNVVVESGGQEVHVARALRGAATRTITQRVEDGILRIEARCRTLLPCGADLALTVPAGLAVDVRTGEGDVRVVGIDADLSIEVGDGDVRGEALLGETVRVRAGWGDARLAFAARPRDVAVGVGVGDVELTVPEGGYHLDLDGLGKPDVRVGRDADGPRLHVRTASGRTSVAPTAVTRTGA